MSQYTKRITVLRQVLDRFSRDYVMMKDSEGLTVTMTLHPELLMILLSGLFNVTWCPPIGFELMNAVNGDLFQKNCELLNGPLQANESCRHSSSSSAHGRCTVCMIGVKVIESFSLQDCRRREHSRYNEAEVYLASGRSSFTACVCNKSRLSLTLGA